MKSRGSSPQTSPQIVKRYRVDSNKEGVAAPSSLRKPSLRIEALPTINSMSGSSPHAMQTRRDSTPQAELLRPIPLGSRKASGDVTPSRPTPNGHHSAYSVSASNPAVSSPPGTENDSPSTTWSSAVGHATTAGKSGRVIERLMAENDKLKRELELTNLRAQELEKSLSMCRPQMEALKQENQNMIHARSVDSSLLGRRDRKIEDLKADNVAKTERVLNAEGLVRQLQREVEEVRGEFERREQGMLEQTKHATVHAEILETSHKQLSAEYRVRREAWEKDLADVQERREHDRQRMAKLDVVYEQMRQENERTRKVQAELTQRWDEMEAAIQSTLVEGDEVNERARNKSVEMERVVDQMRWVMGVQKSASGERKDSKEVG
ncbi:mother-specific HO expression [Teratosphaeriaceae sp. CCFEE 6253]|nr:mother-specific HO expression [Teratosphaeriaceae sp. CCFEE 6253]